jgi:NAD(P)-dependent dehydrogenase (short-subunit alcohol dehydrogenase family)
MFIKMTYNVYDKVVLITGASSGIDPRSQITASTFLLTCATLLLGFGKSLAERLASKGAQLVLSDVNESAGSTLADNINAGRQGINVQAVFIKCDVTDNVQLKDLFDNVVKRYGRLDVSFVRVDQYWFLKSQCGRSFISKLQVCVNNAGISESARFIDDPHAQWKTVIDVDLTGTLIGMR